MNKLKNKPSDKEIEGFRAVVEDLVHLKESKAGDYRGSWRVMGLSGLNNQLMRKMTRIWVNKDKKPGELNNEMMEDSYKDLACYAIMCLQLMKEGDTGDKFLELLMKE